MQQTRSFRWWIALLFTLVWLAACSTDSVPEPAGEAGVFKDDFESGKSEAWSGDPGDSEKDGDDGETGDGEGTQDG